MAVAVAEPASPPRRPRPLRTPGFGPAMPRPASPSSVAPVFIGGVRQLQPTPIALYLPGMRYTAVPRAPGREVQILEVLRLLRDYDPDASQAVWTFVRLANSGHTLSVTAPDGTPVPEAAARLSQFSRDAWKPGGGGIDVLIDTLVLVFLTNGGAGLEVTLTTDLSDIHDVYPFTPADILFRYRGDPADQSLPVLQMYPARSYMGTQSTMTPLNELQVHYQPLDPDTDDPYGRPPLLPAVSAILALMHLIRQMQQVLTVHGYGMRDIVIDEEAVVQLAPQYLKEAGREAELTAYVNAVRSQIEDAVKTLDPTYTFVHFSNIKVTTTPAGGQGIQVGPLITELGRRLTTALKSNNMLLGSTLAREQQYATVQWSVYARGLKAIQRRVQRLLEQMFDTILRVWGVNGNTTLTFGPIRETDRAIEQNADLVQMKVLQQKYELGLITHTQWGLQMNGHEPTGEPPPTAAAKFALAFLTAAGGTNFAAIWPSVQAFFPNAPATLADVGPQPSVTTTPGDQPTEPGEGDLAPPPVEPSASAGISADEFQQLIATATAILSAQQTAQAARR